MIKIPVKPISRQKIWKIVRSIRQALGVEDKLYFDIVNFIERILPAIFPKFEFEVASVSEMGNLHGETFPNQHKIRIREDVYIGACEGNGRDRLTMAHEVGHFLLHDNSIVSFCQLESNEELPKFRDSEWQADVFGAELIAPSYLIESLSINEIHKKCLVSIACASRQLYAVQCEKEKGHTIIPHKS